MKPKPRPEHSRAGKRAPGQTTATISLSVETLAIARQLAAKDGRSLSNWLRRLIERNLAADLAQTPPPPEVLRMNETSTAYQSTPSNV